MSELHRFARHLAASAEAASRGASREPMGLGEIVTRLAPYRGCRRALGLDSAEDYELLLLRLLAEEDGLARGFPPEAVDEARGELGGRNPDLGLLRRLAGATIKLDLVALAQVPDVLPPRSPGQSRVRDYDLAAWEGEQEALEAAPNLRPLPVPPPAPVTLPPMPEPDPAPADESVPEEPVEEEQAVPRPGGPAVAGEPPPEPEPTTILADRLELEWESGDEAEAPAEEPGHAWEPVDEPAQSVPPLSPSADAPREQVPPPRSAPQPEEPGSIVPAGPAWEAPPAAAPEPASVPGTAQVPGMPPEPGSASPAASPPAAAWPASDGGPDGQHSSPCPHCGQVLPVGRRVRFCPSCGRNVAPLRCVRCLSELEPEWRHCVSCGHPVADGSRFA